jgi:hypothetical protein
MTDLDSTANLQSRASESQALGRKDLIRLFKESPIPDDQLLVNLGLYMRSSVIAKFLYANELYQQIVEIPGVVMEFGVWWGQNLALFESFRAVYEPYNYTRKIVGFDTFTGYSSPLSKDGNHSLVKEGAYSTGTEYLNHLKQVLDYHQKENTMSHVKKYELVAGDASEKIESYLKTHPETVISLAYFDMQLYEPTKKCLEAIRPHLVKGSVIAMDELNSDEFPGETVAFREVFGLDKYRIRRSRFLPDRCYFTVE